MVKRFFTIFILGGGLLMLTACSTEQNYRGVPDATWKQLTPQQKQLIVDRSFPDEMK
jgi:hypothetical protein